MPAYLRVEQSRGVVRCVPETPGVPDSDAGFRAANARLRSCWRSGRRGSPSRMRRSRCCESIWPGCSRRSRIWPPGVGAECGEVPGVGQEGEYSGELPDGDREDRGVADPEPGRDPRQALVDRFEESQQRPGHDDVQDDHDRERGYPEAEEPRGGEDVPGGSGWVAGGDQMLDDAEVY